VRQKRADAARADKAARGGRRSPQARLQHAQDVRSILTLRGEGVRAAGCPSCACTLAIKYQGLGCPTTSLQRQSTVSPSEVCHSYLDVSLVRLDEAATEVAHGGTHAGRARNDSHRAPLDAGALRDEADAMQAAFKALLAASSAMQWAYFDLHPLLL